MGTPGRGSENPTPLHPQRICFVRWSVYEISSEEGGFLDDPNCHDLLGDWGVSPQPSVPRRLLDTALWFSHALQRGPC